MTDKVSYINIKTDRQNESKKVYAELRKNYTNYLHTQEFVNMYV